MKNINLATRTSATLIGLLIFFVPFFTYLSPENLKQLSKSNILEIFLSLFVVFILTFIISFSVEMLVKRYFKKNIILFPLLCFAFYLNFSFTPFSDTILSFLYTKFTSTNISTGTIIFIFFEVCCLAIIALGVKFNTFSIRMILIFSILMLVNALIPLVSYLFENIDKDPAVLYEMESKSLAQDVVLKKRNVYYIVLDAMAAIESAEKYNIAKKKEVIASLTNNELKYIDKSISSYSESRLSLTSILLIDYHQTPNSPKPLDNSSIFPLMVYNNELPLVSLLKKDNSSFFWSGNNYGTCIPSSKWVCINSTNEFFSNNLFNFSLSTPLPKILRKIFKDVASQDSITPFLEYIDKIGLPKNQFFAYIHHDSPHNPFLNTSDCEPTNYYNQKFEGYKASYHCALKTIQMFMGKINKIDPDAIVVFQSDHGPKVEDFELALALNKKETYQFEGKLFNAIKAPEICFEKFGLPKTNVNTIRFVLNCAYGFKLPYRENIHYEWVNDEVPGGIFERTIYD